jgi:hypothetical protein
MEKISLMLFLSLCFLGTQCQTLMESASNDMKSWKLGDRLTGDDNDHLLIRNKCVGDSSISCLVAKTYFKMR